jgi:hypothetical protein
MSFVILRTAKLKTAGEIGGSLGHTFRMMDTPNADDSKKHLNEHDHSLEEIKQNIENRLPDTVRKNGVRVVEYLITASPEWKGWGTGAETEFFDNAKKWLKEKHGPENLVGLSVHRDESTPHLVAYVVPIDPQGKLNARHFLGGRQKLSEMQTDFAEQVKHLDLQRGIEGSRAKHTTVKEFYGEIQKPVKPLKEIQLTRLEEQPKSNFLIKNQVHGEKVIDAVYSHIAPQFEQYENQMRAEFSALNAQLSNEKFKNKKLEKQCSSLINSLNQMKNIIEQYDEEFEPFIDLKRKSEPKYEEVKHTARNEHDKILQKEIDSMSITPQSDFEKQIDYALKNIKQLGPAVDLGAQAEKKQEKDKGNDLSM